MVEQNDLPCFDSAQHRWFGQAHHRSKLRGIGGGRGFRCQSVLVSEVHSHRNMPQRVSHGRLRVAERE
jgi:hypothetical protein